MTVSDNKERIKLLKLNSKREHQLHYYSDAYANRFGLPKARLNDEGWRSTMKGILQDLGVKLWVIDNIASLAPGLDENVKQDWDPINQWLLDLRFAGICTIMLHHTNKAGGQRGTSAREDNLDVSILLDSPFDYSPDEGARFIFRFSKARIANKYLGLIADTEFKLLQDQSGHYTWSYRDVKKPSKQRVIKKLGDGMRQIDIHKDTGLSTGQVSKIKTWAVKEGYLSPKGKLTFSGKAYVSEVG
jgi:putative DNA primase/helicase